MKPELLRASEVIQLHLEEMGNSDAAKLLIDLRPVPGVHGWGEAWLKALVELNILFSQAVQDFLSIPELTTDEEKKAKRLQFNQVQNLAKSLDNFRFTLATVLERGLNE